MTPTFDPNGNPLKLALATLLMQAVWDCCLEVFGAPRDALRGPLLGPIRPMPYGAPKDDPHKAYALARVWEKQPVLNVHFPLTMFTSTLWWQLDKHWRHTHGKKHILHCAIVCYGMWYYAMSCYIMSYYVVNLHIILCWLLSITWYRIVLYYVMLYFIVVYHIILFHVIHTARTTHTTKQTQPHTRLRSINFI